MDFGFGKKYNEKKEQMINDPQKGLDDAGKTLNTGVSGFLTKTFLGKDFVNDMNKTMDMGRDAMELAQRQQNLYQNGLQATAEVITIQDTGQLINYNPVVVMQLKVQPQFEAPFDTTVQTMVSKIAIPRVGDTINIKYNQADRTQIVVI